MHVKCKKYDNHLRAQLATYNFIPFHNIIFPGVKSVILSVVSGYSNDFQSSWAYLPKPLTELYDKAYTKLDFDKLVEKSKEAFEALEVTMEEVHIYLIIMQ